MDLSECVAAEIRGELGKKRMTYTDLADALGKSRQYVSQKIATRTTTFTDVELDAIGTAVGVPGWEIMRRAKEAQRSEKKEGAA